MTQMNPIKDEILRSQTIRVHEPFAEFLGAGESEVTFDLSLLDVVRFAGHACPSMVGAFLLVKRAVQDLYSETCICERGDLAIEIPGSAESGPLGPMANVFGYVTGAWSGTGFGGLQGRFKRRHLLSFNPDATSEPAFSFTRLSIGRTIRLTYTPSLAVIPEVAGEPFQRTWRRRIAKILEHPEQVIRVL